METKTQTQITQIYLPHAALCSLQQYSKLNAFSFVLHVNAQIQEYKHAKSQEYKHKNLSPPHVFPNNTAFELQSPNEKGPVNKEKDILLNLHKRLRLFYLGIYSLSAHNTVIG